MEHAAIVEHDHISGLEPEDHVGVPIVEEREEREVRLVPGLDRVGPSGGDPLRAVVDVHCGGEAGRVELDHRNVGRELGGRVAVREPDRAPCELGEVLG
jgi:hypothetical protein